MKLEYNVSLAPCTTWKIGGPAKFFVRARSVEEIREAVQWAHAHHTAVRILGNGSNTLVADRGFDGLIIVAQNDQLQWQDGLVMAGAGVKLGQLIAGALQHGQGGLAWLIGVPGTVGGSIYGNAGAGMTEDYFGKFVVTVDGLRPDGSPVQWTKDECQFGYRDSRFKHEPVLILQALLQLPAVDAVAERKLLADKSASKNKSQPLTLASAGCLFKNATVEPSSLPTELQTQVNPNGTISAWRLIKAVDLQGKQIGQMQISPLHASFMINLGGGTADQALQLISLVKQQVRDKLGVQLQEEIQYLGF